MADIERIVTQERPSTHGEFSENGSMTWRMLGVLMGAPGWDRLSDGQKHACYMIIHKMTRAVSGDPNFADHWDDVGGYAKLVSDRIEKPVPMPERDMYAALAVGWGCTREEAKKRAYQMSVERRREREARPVHVASNVIIQSTEEAIDPAPTIGRTKIVGQEVGTGFGVVGFLMGYGSVSRNAYVQDDLGVTRQLSHFEVVEVSGTPEDGGHHAE